MSFLRILTLKKSLSIGLNNARETVIKPSFVTKPIFLRSFHDTRFRNTLIQSPRPSAPGTGAGPELRPMTKMYKNNVFQLCGVWGVLLQPSDRNA
ncbi:hypothetical protein PGT21_019362 [Puccinia graminis f. sp. tritici]|uniref:Uncharacterized protein n=1 Tax=Puccinia graminis f. sp. tritici TaxID=56615 RepID=A0A5B0QB01_PUCGR|nr:hypothetical protein PGT21_019362 [Puccinia graminis f. sp. tritici]